MMQIINTVFYILYCADFNAKWELQQNFKMRLYCHDFGLLIRRDRFYRLRRLVSKPRKQAANCSMRKKELVHALLIITNLASFIITVTDSVIITVSQMLTVIAQRDHCNILICHCKAINPTAEALFQRGRSEYEWSSQAIKE